MPMPNRDPSRFIEAVLADPTHKLPLPDRGNRLFLAEGETIDQHHPFYAALLADGSLKVKIAEQPKAEEPAAPLPPAKAEALMPTVHKVDPLPPAQKN